MDNEQINENETLDTDIVKSEEQDVTNISNDSVQNEDIESLRKTVEEQSQLIKELTEKLTEMFKEREFTKDEPNEIEDYLNSEDSITGRLLRNYGIIE